MFALISASLLGGVITVIGFWHRLGLYSFLIAPLGAAAGTILAGLILACIRAIRRRSGRIPTPQKEACRTITAKDR